MSGSQFFDYGAVGAGDGTTSPAGAGTPPASAPSSTFLAAASPDDWSVIVSHCERRRVRRGEVVLPAGDTDRSLLIVLAGRLDTVAERRGRSRRLSPAPAGSVIGELGFLDGGPRAASVVAATDADVLRLSFDAFEVLAATNPRLGRMVLLDLGRIVAGRLREMLDVVVAR